MTYLFFFTKTPEMMKTSTSIEAEAYSKRMALSAESVKYQFACDQFANSFGFQVPEMDLNEFAPQAASNIDVEGSKDSGSGGLGYATQQQQGLHDGLDDGQPDSGYSGPYSLEQRK